MHRMGLRWLPVAYPPCLLMHSRNFDACHAKNHKIIFTKKGVLCLLPPNTLPTQIRCCKTCESNAFLQAHVNVQNLPNQTLAGTLNLQLASGKHSRIKGTNAHPVPGRLGWEPGDDRKQSLI